MTSRFKDLILTFAEIERESSSVFFWIVQALVTKLLIFVIIYVKR